MKAVFYRILPALLVVWVLLASYWYVCEIKYHNCSCFRHRPTNIPAWVLTDGIDTLLHLPSGITFGLGSAEPQLSTDQRRKLVGIATYLATHPNKRLLIDAAYIPPTEASSIAPARAKNMELLIKAALNELLGTVTYPDSLFAKQYTVQSAPIVFQDTVFNVLQLRIQPRVPLSDEQLQQLMLDTLRLHFDTKTADVQLLESSRHYIKQVEAALNQRTNLRLHIVGHTDNASSAQTNYQLGLKRANITKDWLSQMGINQQQMVVSSAGETQPLVPNFTERDRKQNRRVEIFLK